MTTTPIRWKELSAAEKAALIADVVMGWKKTRRPIDDVITGYGDDHEGKFRRLPDYATDLSAAFQVAEKMREKGFEVVIHGGSPLDTHPDFIWDVTIQYPTDPFDAGSASTETLPEACCLAALTAIGLTIERE